MIKAQRRRLCYEAHKCQRIFTTEDAKKTDNVMRAFNKLAGGGETYYDEVKSVIKTLNDAGATKGHYFRGVE